MMMIIIIRLAANEPFDFVAQSLSNVTTSQSENFSDRVIAAYLENDLCSPIIDNVGRLRSNVVVVEQVWVYTKDNQR